MIHYKVGISIEKTFVESDSGAFYYYQTLLNHFITNNYFNDKIKLIDFTSKENYSIFNLEVQGLNISGNVKYNFQNVPILNRLLQRVATKRKIKETESTKLRLKNICDFVYFLTPLIHFTEYPYICTNWDLGANSMVYFPTINSLRSISTYKNMRPNFEYNFLKSQRIVVESEAGKKELLKYFSVPEIKISIIKMFPSDIISGKVQSVKPLNIDINKPFLFYNAQYTAHKNHINLLLAFKKYINESNKDVNLVLCGQDKGNKNHITKNIKKLKLESNVIVFDFLSKEELKYLYENSNGLIYTSFLGPTNMPPLEAMYLNCPMAISNLDGHIEQIGKSAFYFNPFKVDEIYDGIQYLMNFKEDKIDFEVNNFVFDIECFVDLFETTYAGVINWAENE